ncbi:hypothetical protein ACFFUT_17585 [Pseudohalocynthiibacter aestuariivivens]|uniref:Uncharacterized protein n=1 Tax=Pseudohalocynthiibacter aestuariivivens TaxID=1591409 RepID=A0ABV5JJH5_9RHOB|nr:hypothetical protein [Pseudohalocynthiibacter sp. F2068]
MFSRLAGAILRAILVALLIATPSLLLPSSSPETTQIVTLIALFSAALVIFEYASVYPSLIEFRDAPPFNRVRFMSLFVTVFLLSVISRGQIEPTNLTQFVQAVGGLIGYAIDFPYSPVRLVLQMFPTDTSADNIFMVRTAAGLAYLISLITLTIFIIILRLQGWPVQGRSFNVWVNLPTFDPTAGGDVVVRLIRDARLNIILGFVLPFLTPVVVSSASTLFTPVTVGSPQTLIWTVSAWAFLPASLFMRGIAMHRIAEMIREQRRQAYELAALEQGFAPS